MDWLRNASFPPEGWVYCILYFANNKDPVMINVLPDWPLVNALKD